MSLSRMASVDYLIDHVAAGDGRASDPSASPLTRYYTAEGYPPGTWLGSGIAALGAANMAGSEVTEGQLRELFEGARNPFTGEPLGRPPAKYPTRQERIDRRVSKLPADLTGKARAALIEKIATEEKETKTRTAVAGFDLTFSVPKSVSALWALAPASVQEQLYLAHRAALTSTLELIENEAVFTRLGHNGVRRVRTAGLVAAAFDHWDSRKGDPQLHTHVTVANRVQGPDGRWRTLDSATLHQAAVAYSETYDLLLADEITRRTGLTWDHRERKAGSNRRVGRELTPVPDALIAAYSQRSADIETAVDTAIAQVVQRTGRRPDVNGINRIRQHLTLTTRDRKHAPNLAESVQQWRATAEHVLDRDPSAWAATVTDSEPARPLLGPADLDDVDAEAIALGVVDAVAAARPTWTRWNLTAETMRQLAARGLQFATPTDAVQVRDQVVAAAERLSVALTPPELVPTPNALRDADGASPFNRPEVFTSTAVLAAEDKLLQLVHDRSGPAVHPDRAQRAADQDLPGRDHPLAEEDQRPAAVQIVTSGRVVEVLVGPAGTGKTTTMAGVRVLWEAQHGPGSVVGLAPSAMAAQVLAADLGVVTDNTAQWIAQQDQQPRREQRIRVLTEAITKSDNPVRIQGLRAALDRVGAERDRWRLHPGQLLIIDEAGMTGTFTLARLAGQAADAGAKLLLVGDPNQLSAVEAGGAFGLLCARHPDPPTLTQVRRFVDPDGTRRVWEEQAADRLRAGDPTALADYADHHRIHSGEQDRMTDAAYTAWSADVRAGRSSVLIAADNDTVTELNRRAQADLTAAGLVEDTPWVPVRNGLSVGRGDVVVTRRIDRTQPDGTTGSSAVGGGRRGDGFVRNGQRWQVQRAHQDGSLTVRLLDGDRPGRLPVTLTAAYVREHVDLGYATTAHRAQGLTVDTAHVLADALTQREPFYVAMTRGRHANHAYLVLDPATTLRDRLAHPVGGPADQDSYTTAQVADAITAHADAAMSAHETIQAEQERAVSIRQLADEADAIAGYAHDLATGELLLTVLSDTPAVHRILDDEHFPDLVLAIRRAHSKGIDLHGQLPVIIGTRRPDTLTAQTLTTIVHTHLRHSGGRSPVFVAGIVVDATDGLSDPELVDAVRQRYELIEQRADQLATDATNSGEPWTRSIPPWIPDDRRFAVIRVLAAYRERWDVSGPEPLGRQPDPSANPSHQADHRRMTEMLRRLSSQTHSRPPTGIEQSTRTTGRTL